MPDLIIDQVTDNGDNSLTIIGHDENGSYESGLGRKSDLPEKTKDQMAYYQVILTDAIPSDNPVLYQTPEYKKQLADEALAEEEATSPAENNQAPSE